MHVITNHSICILAAGHGDRGPDLHVVSRLWVTGLLASDPISLFITFHHLACFIIYHGCAKCTSHLFRNHHFTHCWLYVGDIDVKANLIARLWVDISHEPYRNNNIITTSVGVTKRQKCDWYVQYASYMIVRQVTLAYDNQSSQNIHLTDQ